jgi:nucleoside-diphosphate-sugar epimerase
MAQLVIPRLLAQGHIIVGADNFSRHGQVQRERKYEIISADLCDTASVKQVYAAHQYDCVFHFAAMIFGVMGMHKRAADIISTNDLITNNLLKYGHDKVKRFVYLSSSMVYETSRSYPHMEDETDTLPVMRSAYGLSKYIGERVIQAYRQQYGTTYVFWRPFNVIAPTEKAEETGFSHVFTDMIEKIIAKKLSPVPVLGDGEQIRCFANLSDIVDVISDYSLRPEADNQAMNIGNPEPLTIKELAAKIVTIGKRLGVVDPGYKLSFECKPVPDEDVKKRIPDVSKLKRLFGWEPKVLVDQSLEQCIRTRFKL